MGMVSTYAAPAAATALAVSLGKDNLAALSAYLDAAAPVVVPGGTQTGGTIPNSNGIAALSAIEAEVAAQMGVSPDAFKAAQA